eukprot:TRINITY_DN59725_c0_g2_i1.p1 TRINITY_DN59725_c0_g2~~TRINITY_DN59725_c0_g2_i1.p1  ORF type:complete len:388 (+),score=77.44 TRINITY_DN59725_c0_g2_i1:145-1308(+)
MATCEDLSVEAECTKAEGLADSPCIWRNMGERAGGATVAWCKSCGSECAPPPAQSEDAGRTVVIILVVCVVVTGIVALTAFRFRHLWLPSLSSKGSSAPPKYASPTSVVATGPDPAAAPADAAMSAGEVPEGAVDGVLVDLGPPQVPAYWTTTSGSHIVPKPELVPQMQRFMSAAWEAKYSRDRKMVAGSSEVPVGCKVLNVLHVQNHPTWAKYWNYKQSVARRRRGSHGSPCGDFDAMTSREQLQGLDAEVNEMFLFHGTKPAAAEQIALDDFAISKAGTSRGTMFGPGIYLAENACKSDEYAKDGDGVFAGMRAVLICRAVAGRVCTVLEPGDHSARVQSGEYDSICGDRLAAVGTYREMIFFNQEAVYTEYIAIYQRLSGMDSE